MRSEYDAIILSVRTSHAKKVDTFDKVFNQFNTFVPYLDEKLKKSSKKDSAYVSDDGKSREKISSKIPSSANRTPPSTSRNLGCFGGKKDKKSIPCFKFNKFVH